LQRDILNKMKLVVDANVLFSLLIKEGKTKELFMDFSLDLYAPEFVFDELEKHRQEILEKTKRSNDEFNSVLDIFEKIVKVVPTKDLTAYAENAKQISPDENDVSYFALALKLNCPIWSNDKELKKQNKIKVYSTEDLINALKDD